MSSVSNFFVLHTGRAVASYEVTENFKLNQLNKKIRLPNVSHNRVLKKKKNTNEGNSISNVIDEYQSATNIGIDSINIWIDPPTHNSHASESCRTPRGPQ